MEQYWIYKITNIVDNKVYIGSSLNVKQRKGNHFRNLKSEKHHSAHLQRAYNKYGRGSFLFDIVEVGEYNFSYSELLLIEDKWVLYYESLNPNKGYNKSLPSLQITLEYSINKSKNGYENYILEKGPFNLKSMSKEEWIEKRRINPKFKIVKLPKENPIIQRKRVFQIDTTTNKIIDVFESQANCEKKLNIMECSLRDALVNNVKDCKYHKLRKGVLLVREFQYFEGFTYKPYKGSKPKKEVPIKKPIILPIIKIQNLDTLEIKEFNYYSEIASFLDVSHCRIMELKKGFKNKGKGVIRTITNVKRWKFINN